MADPLLSQFREMHDIPEPELDDEAFQSELDKIIGADETVEETVDHGDQGRLEGLSETASALSDTFDELEQKFVKQNSQKEQQASFRSTLDALTESIRNNDSGILSGDIGKAVAETPLTISKTVHDFSKSWGIIRDPEDRRKAGVEELASAEWWSQFWGAAKAIYGKNTPASEGAGGFNALIAEYMAEQQEKRVVQANKALSGEAPLPTQSAARSAIEGGAHMVVRHGVAAIVKTAGIAGEIVSGVEWGDDGVSFESDWDNPVIQTARDIESLAQKYFPGDPARQYQFVDQVGKGVGSTVAFYGAGVLASIARLGERGVMGATALAGIAAQSSEEFEAVSKAMKAGDATDRDMLLVMLSSIPIGAAEALPFAQTTSRTVSPRLRTWLSGKLGEKTADNLIARGGMAMEQAIEEMLQESSAGFATNVVARLTYDPRRNLLEGVPEGLAVGGVVGGAFGAAGRGGPPSLSPQAAGDGVKEGQSPEDRQNAFETARQNLDEPETEDQRAMPGMVSPKAPVGRDQSLPDNRTDISDEDAFDGLPDDVKQRISAAEQSGEDSSPKSQADVVEEDGTLAEADDVADEIGVAFDVISAALPKDKNGDPDFERLTSEVEKLGKSAWKDLTPEEQTAVQDVLTSTETDSDVSGRDAFEANLLGITRKQKLATIAEQEGIELGDDVFAKSVEDIRNLILEAKFNTSSIDQAPNEVSEVVTPDGAMRVLVRPQIVELDDLTFASGDLQPRDRSRAESAAGVRQRAAGLDPARLQSSRTSDAGAPIILTDGTILSGNGRTMSIAEVYDQPALKAQADAYRASLGDGAKGFKKPVLVRTIEGPLSQDDLIRFADLSNRSQTAAMSATERAERDARAAGAEVMGLYNGGSFTSPINSEFFRAFQSQVVSESERGQMSRDGQVTKEGQDRMTAAVLAAAYGDSDLLARMLESTDDNIRSITGALRDAAGSFIRQKEAIRAGNASSAFDITPQIVETAKKIADLRDRNIKPQTFLDQQDAFTDLDPVVESLLRAFYNDDLSRALSKEKLTEVLILYAEEGQKHQDNGLIPDETRPEDIITYAKDKATSEARLQKSQGNLFGSRAGTVGGDTRRSRRDDAGSTIESSEPSADQVRASLEEKFRGILAGTAPQKQWPDLLGITDQDLRGEGGLIEWGLKEKLLRKRKNGVARAPRKSIKGSKPSDRIDDIGEKIGGARKDLSVKTGKKPQTRNKNDDRPVWARQFAVVENKISETVNQQPMAAQGGNWLLVDRKSGRILPMNFETEAAAEAAIPLAAVAIKHRVRFVREGDVEKYAIFRDVSKTKTKRVVAQSFDSRESAQTYMAQNAVDILETKTSFGEEILKLPDKVVRTGKERRQGDVTPDQFQNVFGFRGVEFGNWNNQAERQDVMNHAFDGLLDLADVLGVPPQALSLNGNLALAFGARGQGLSGARAHYEPSYGVINLTKMSGAGTLAHEWFHGFDHYLRLKDASKDGERITNKSGDKVLVGSGARGRDFATHGFLLRNSQLRDELKTAMRSLVETMYRKAEKYVQDTEKAEKWLSSARNSLRQNLERIRSDLASERDKTYYKRHNKPATPEQLAEFDALAEGLLNGSDLRATWVDDPKSKRQYAKGRHSNDTLERLSAILKKVRGRNGFTSNNKGTLDRLRQTMRVYAERIDTLNEAKAKSTKTRKVPTSYAMDAKSIDQGRATDYWTTYHEMAARAFSAYVEDKIDAQGYRSDFLSFGSDNKYYIFDGIRPFPAGREREAINAKFDELFDVLETQATDSGVAMYALQAFHGSIHDFDQFAMEKVNTGEGVQAFGYGLYFTQDKSVANFYKNKLRVGPATAVKSYIIGSSIWGRPQEAKTTEDFLKYKSMPVDPDLVSLVDSGIEEYKKSPESTATVNILREIDSRLEQPGLVYEVEISAKDEDLLLFDKSFQEQSAKVRSYIREALKGSSVFNAWQSNGALEHVSGKTLYETLGGDLVAGNTEGQKRVSRALSEAGIKGIKFLDGNSRGIGEGYYNYVVFDDSIVTITKKNDVPLNVDYPTAEQVAQDDVPMYALMTMPGNYNGPLSLKGMSDAVAMAATDEGFQKIELNVGAHILNLANDNKDVPLATPIGEQYAKAFFNQAIERQDGGSVTATNLYETYAGWAEMVGLDVMALPAFGRAFAGANGIQKAKISGRVRYIGIGIKDDPLKGASKPEIVERQTPETTVFTGQHVNDNVRDLDKSREQGKSIWQSIKDLVKTLSGDTKRSRHAQRMDEIVESIASDSPLYAIQSMAPEDVAAQDTDDLGFFLEALRAARNLKQERGTPEQMLSQLKKAGLTEAEIEATGLNKFFHADVEFGSTDSAVNSFKSRVNSLRQHLNEKTPLSRDDEDFAPSPFKQYGLLANKDLAKGLDRASKTRPQKKTVHLADLYSEQSSVEGNVVSRMLSRSENNASDLPSVYSVDGKLFIKDGNHRLATKALNGEVTSLVNVYGTNTNTPKSSGVSQITKQDIIKHLEDNRVEVRESVYERYTPGEKSKIVIDGNDYVPERAIETVFDGDEAAERKAMLKVARNHSLKAYYDAAEEMVVDIRLKMGLEADDFDRVAMKADVVGETPKYQNWSLSKDKNDPTYKETVVHLPATRRMPFAEFLAAHRQRFKNSDLTDSEIRDIYEGGHELPGPDSFKSDKKDVFQSGHWSEPNIIAHYRSQHLKTDKGETSLNIDELQSDWGQKLRDDQRNGVAQKLFQKRHDDLSDAQKKQVTQHIKDNPDDVPMGRDEAKVAELQTAHDRITKERNTHLEKGRALAGKFGQTEIGSSVKGALMSARDRAKTDKELNEINALIEEIDDATSRRDLVSAELRTAEKGAVGNPLVNTTGQWVNVGLKKIITDAVNQGVDGITITPGKVQADRYGLTKHLDYLAHSKRADGTYWVFAKNKYGDRNDVEGHYSADELPGVVGQELAKKIVRRDGDPYITASYQSIIDRGRGVGVHKNGNEWYIRFENGDSLGTFLSEKDASGEMMRINRDYIDVDDNVRPRKLVGDDLRIGGEGMKYAYDTMYPKKLTKLLQKIDNSIKPETRSVETVGTVFYIPLSDQVREQVRRNGLPLFGQPKPAPQGAFSLAATKTSEVQLTPEFEELKPDFADLVRQQVEAMLPPDVAVNVLPRLTDPSGSGAEIFGLFLQKTVSLSLAGGPKKALEIGRHEVVHALRSAGLFTDQEWALLLERARKVKIDNKITALDTASGKQKPAMPVYEAIYRSEGKKRGLHGVRLDAFVEERLNQERVAKMAELWASKDVRYGKTIDGLFQRIVDFLEAIGNAFRGLGFQTPDSIFDTMVEGGIASRAEVEPSLEPVLPLLAIGALHGSNNKFDNFDPDQLRDGLLQWGVNASTNANVVKRFARAQGRGNAPNQAVSDAGYVYKLEYPYSTDELLIWDAPGPQQSTKVKSGLKGVIRDLDKQGDKSNAATLARYLRGQETAYEKAFGWAHTQMLGIKHSGLPNVLARLANQYGGQRQTAEMFAHHGIKGIKYPFEKNTNHFVFFEPNRVAISEVKPADQEINFDLGGGLASIAAFHGSPHSFDKFSLDGIGTGGTTKAWHASAAEFDKFDPALAGKNPNGGGPAFPGSIHVALRKEISGPDGAWTAAVKSAEGRVHVYEVDLRTDLTPMLHMRKRFDQQTPEVQRLILEGLKEKPNAWPRIVSQSTFNGESFDRHNPSHFAAELINNRTREEAIQLAENMLPDATSLRLKRKIKKSITVLKKNEEAVPDQFSKTSTLAEEFNSSWSFPADPLGFKLISTGDEVAILDPSFADIVKRDGKNVKIKTRKGSAVTKGPEFDTATSEDSPMYAFASLPSKFTRSKNELDVNQGNKNDHVDALSEIIAEVKSGLGMTVTQGRYGLTVSNPETGQSRRFSPQSNLRGQYDGRTGAARVRRSTDIEAIAHEGGHHLEAKFGQSLRDIKRDGAAELEGFALRAINPDRDTVRPRALPPQGFSGYELSETQQTLLIEAVNARDALDAVMTEIGTEKSKPRLSGKAKVDTAREKEAQALAARTRNALNLSLGRSVADVFTEDVRGGLDRVALGVEDYVRMRFSETGTPQKDAPKIYDQVLISEGFAEFFRTYILHNREARDRAPDFYEAFEDMLDGADPSLLDSIDRMQLLTASQSFKAYSEATSLDRARADLVSYADQRLTTRVKDFLSQVGQDGTVSGWASVIYDAALDKIHPFYLMTRSLLLTADANKITDDEGRAVSLAVHENPYKLMRSVSDAFKTGLRWIQDGMPNYRHGDAGWRVESQDGRILGTYPTELEAKQAAEQNQSDKPVIKPNAGYRSASLHSALNEAMKGDWNHDTYNDFGVYLESRRAIEEWNSYNKKLAKIDRLGQALKAIQRETSALRVQMASLKGKQNRRSDGLTALDALIIDRDRQGGRLEAKERKDLLILTDASATPLRRENARQRLVNLRQEMAKVDAERDDLEAKRQTLEAETSDIDQQVADLEATISQNESAADVLKTERRRAAETGVQRAPHRLPLETHQRHVKQLDALHPQFKSASEKVYDFLWQSAVHDFQAGRLTQAELDYRATRKHFYVPFWRDLSDIVSEQRGLGGNIKRFSKDKAFKGSDRAIVNPIESIIDQSFHRAAATHFNEVMTTLGQLADRAGVGGAQIAEKVNREELIEANQDGFDKLEQDLVALGYDAEDARDMVKRVEGDFGDAQLLLQWSPENFGAKRPLLVPLWENGQRNYLRINDPEFAQMVNQTVNGIGKEMASLFIDALAKPATLLRIGVTTNPAFIGPNMIRDSAIAWGLTGSLMNPKTWPGITQVRGLYHEVMQTEYARMYQEVGGIMGGQNVAALSKVRDKADVMALEERGMQIKPLNAIASAAAGAAAGVAIVGTASAAAPALATFGAVAGLGAHKGLREFVPTFAHFADMSETATRLGVFATSYRAALKYNPSLTPYQAAQEAAYVSRDLIDFGRHGSRMLGAARLIPFLNANLQGMDKQVRQFLARSDRGYQMSFTKTAGIATIAGYSASLIGGPLVAGAAAVAAPAIQADLMARSEAVRGLLKPWLKKEYGLPLSRDDERALGDSAKAWGHLVAYSMVLLAIAALYVDDDEYEMIDARFKWRAQPIKLGGDWYAIPKAFEWGIPSNLIEAAIDEKYKNDPRFWERVRGSLSEALTPPGIPQVARLWSDIRGNHNSLSGRPIVPEYMKKLEPQSQFSAYTSEFAIEASKRINESGWAKPMAQGIGRTIFANDKFEITPAIIDYALTSSLAYWGKDIQKGSNTFRDDGRRSDKIKDFPIVGTTIQRLQVDPFRAADATRAFWDQMSTSGGRYPRAAAEYSDRLKDNGIEEANIYLATLPEDEQVYALVQEQKSASVKKFHPLNRLDTLMRTVGKIQREIMFGEVNNTEMRSERNPMSVSPGKAHEVRAILQQIVAMESSNTMRFLEHDQFKSRKEFEVRAVYDILKQSHPKIYDELELRFRRKKMKTFSDIKKEWPRIKADLLGEWERSSKRGERVPGGKRFRY